jgi:hypothetical protein
MTGLIILDSAPLGYICNSRNRDGYKKLKDFIKSIGFYIRVPEIIDYGSSGFEVIRKTNVSPCIAFRLNS